MPIRRGVDISGHQNVTSFSALADAVEFVIVKATEREGYTSPAFGEYFTGARRAGMLVGAYHFGGSSVSRTLGDPDAEARHYVSELRTVGYRPGEDLPPILDIEIDDRSDAAMTRWCRAFVEEVDQLLDLAGRPARQRCGLYFPSSWYFDHFDGDELTRDRWWWVAAWPDPDGAWPNSVLYANALIWQWTDRVDVPGVTAPCDGNVSELAYLQTMAPDHYDLEDDMSTPHDVWFTDDLIEAPASDPDRESNPHWEPQRFLRELAETVLYNMRKWWRVRLPWWGDWSEFDFVNDWPNGYTAEANLVHTHLQVRKMRAEVNAGIQLALAKLEEIRTGGPLTDAQLAELEENLAAAAAAAIQRIELTVGVGPADAPDDGGTP